MATQEELTTYIALFHTRDRAAAAIRDLENSGFSSEALTVIQGRSEVAAGDSRGGFGSQYGYGDAENLGEFGVPDRDQKHLQDGLNQGGTILVLKGAGDRATEIEKIFHEHSTAKIDETDMERSGFVAPLAAEPVAATATDSMVIPITQEELVVGKREVDRGGVRVFRRVVEEPVTESVSLHEEHVVVERRPVDRAVTEADVRQGDRTIELKEMAEEAVVSKTARVVQEVLIGKQETDRTETIRDTVRHTEVDVEQVDADEVSGTDTRRTN